VKRDHLTPSPSLSRRERNRRAPFPSFRTSKLQAPASGRCEWRPEGPS
jgi:hypothetical protein